MNKKTLYTVTEWAHLKNISRTAVQKKINAGKLNAEKVGTVWIIKISEKD